MTEPLILTDFDELGCTPDDATLMAAMFAKLTEHYPGHPWWVTADHEHGYATIRLPYYDKLRVNKDAAWAYILHIHNLNSDPTLRRVVKAGGEMLERYGLPRERQSVDYETRLRAVEHGLDLTSEG